MDRVTLGELAAPYNGAIAIGPFGSAMKADTYSLSGVPVIRGTNISDTRAWKGDWVFVPEVFADRMHRCTVRCGDLVLPHRGSIGEVAIIPDDHQERYILSSSLMTLTIDQNKAIPIFVYYYLRSAGGRHEILKYASQVGTPVIGQPLQSLRQFVVPLPALGDQSAVASTLGALDDKIDLNRRMNETLEAMARAIFQDWFVTFGPTRAKQEGRPPYLTPDLWSLFPNRLNDDSKPEGWQNAPLLEHAQLISGGTPKTDVAAYWDGDIAWASAKDVSQCTDPFLITTERSITNSGLAESATKLIPTFATVVVARGATTGRFCMFGGEMAMNQTCYALVSRSKRPFWLNCAFNAAVGSLVNAAHGSVFDTITTRTIEGGFVVHASGGVLDEFEAMVAPLFMRIHANVEESRTLSATRDLLLPKLMSGELRGKDAEAAMEAAL